MHPFSPHLSQPASSEQSDEAVVGASEGVVVAADAVDVTSGLVELGGTVESSATHWKLTHLGVSGGQRLPRAPPQMGSNIVLWLDEVVDTIVVALVLEEVEGLFVVTLVVVEADGEADVLPSGLHKLHVTRQFFTMKASSQG